MSFKISDKVVCVEAFCDIRIQLLGLDMPAIDTIYVVNESFCISGVHGIKLVGMNCGGFGYESRNFRLLSDVKEENARKAQSDDFMKFAGDHYSRVFKSLCEPDDNPDLPRAIHPLPHRPLLLLPADR